MNQKKTIMGWIDELPNVDSETKARRDEIAELVTKGDKLRSEAYFKSLTLEKDAKSRWTADQINKAKATAKRKGTY